MPTTAMQQMVDWATNLPQWAQDGLRRACQRRTLTPQDHNEIYHMAMAEAGLPVANSTAPSPVPLTAEHLNAALESPRTFLVTGLKEVRNVNALATDQHLTFAPDGITVVFGHNGSGKSGYSRIFKSACRARDSEDILPDIANHNTGKPSAIFEVAPTGDRSTTTDSPGIQTPPRTRSPPWQCSMADAHA